jgi:phage shock protein PspC (stress-responsive transcriptional regulator)
MNKTVTINISGIIFHIEEDAYEKLSKYLATIKSYFSNTDGGNEIMADIEARIAEMLQGKTSAVKQVVLMADVDSVIETMGKPEEFAGEDHPHQEQSSQTNGSGNAEGTVRKRLFRDPDHKAVGGVCSGIAAYFDVEIVWIRLAMFLLLFPGGMSLWVYIILWIVIPEAKTTAEKLAMRGEKIDINNISKTVMEEAEQVKRRMEKYGQDFHPHTRNFFDKLTDFLGEFFRLIGKVFVRIVGFILLIFGICFMFSFVASIFGFSLAGNDTEFNDWISLIFLERSHYTLGMFGLILFAGIPIFMMIYGGVKLLFKIPYSNRWLNIGAGLVWFIGFIIVAYVGVSTGKDFNEGGKIKETVQLTQHDTLYLKMSPGNELFNKLHIDATDNEEDIRHGKVKVFRRNDNYLIGEVNGKKQIVRYARLNIVPSTTENFELVMVKEARGDSKRTASERARAIQYKVIQNDSVLNFDQVFTVEPGEKFRVQELQLILKVPNGKVVHLDENMKHLIWDVENTTNTWDPEMAGRRWKMTREGLACIDCDGLVMNNEDMIPPPPTPPGAPLLDIQDKDAKVKIDKNGIDIKSKDGNVKIGKDGIHIDARDKKKED